MDVWCNRAQDFPCHPCRNQWASYGGVQRICRTEVEIMGPSRLLLKIILLHMCSLKKSRETPKLLILPFLWWHTESHRAMQCFGEEPSAAPAPVETQPFLHGCIHHHTGRSSPTLPPASGLPKQAQPHSGGKGSPPSSWHAQPYHISNAQRSPPLLAARSALCRVSVDQHIKGRMSSRI